MSSTPKQAPSEVLGWSKRLRHKTSETTVGHASRRKEKFLPKISQMQPGSPTRISERRQRRRRTRCIPRSPPPRTSEPPKKRKHDHQPSDDSSSQDSSESELESDMPLLKKLKLDDPEAILKIIADSRRARDAGTLAACLGTAGRFMFRRHGPLVKCHNSLALGVYAFEREDADIYTAAQKLHGLKHATRAEVDKCVAIFDQLLEAVPDFKVLIPALRSNGTHLLNVGAFLDGHARAARSDDINRIKNHLHMILQRRRTSPCNHQGHACLARLLVPHGKRDLFDEDPKKFMCDVREGRIKITGHNIPSFMLDDDIVPNFNPRRPEIGALKSKIVEWCWNLIYKGPNAAIANTAPGIRGIAKKNAMTQVTPESLTYTCLLLQFALSAQRKWSEDDGLFRGATFIKSILFLFEDPEWAEDTLKWWNLRIFDTHGTQNVFDDEMEDDDEMAVILRHHAARQLNETQARWSPGLEYLEPDELPLRGALPLDDTLPLDDALPLRGALPLDDALF
ncbi:hypothetical protein A0H81_14118 [Grifola frondosa]|uniref:Uncharacterized protein n=1 Tax=Grifola frondosa TaxID=5627 RepID=A0A1C7LMB9_GRIFR|nr:hypothetical protein A0H81_14118 [Grifola frondosa]